MRPKYFNIVENRRALDLGEIKGIKEMEILETGNKGDVSIVINGVETPLENVGSLKLNVNNFDSLDVITKSVNLDIKASDGKTVYVKSPEQILNITRVEELASEKSKRAQIDARRVDEVIIKNTNNLSLSASGEYIPTKKGSLLEVKKVNGLYGLEAYEYETLIFKQVYNVKTKPTIVDCNNIIFNDVTKSLEEELKKYLENKKI